MCLPQCIHKFLQVFLWLLLCVSYGCLMSLPSPPPPPPSQRTHLVMVLARKSEIASFPISPCGTRGGFLSFLTSSRWADLPPATSSLLFVPLMLCGHHECVLLYHLLSFFQTLYITVSIPLCLIFFFFWYSEFSSLLNIRISSALYLFVNLAILPAIVVKSMKQP